MAKEKSAYTPMLTRFLNDEENQQTTLRQSFQRRAYQLVEDLLLELGMRKFKGDGFATGPAVDWSACYYRLRHVTSGGHEVFIDCLPYMYRTGAIQMGKECRVATSTLLEPALRHLAKLIMEVE